MTDIVSAPPRLGLALSGGGARGAYTAGALLALQEEGVLGENLAGVSALHGVSTGALVASLVACGRFDLLEEVYTTVRTADVLRSSHRILARCGSRWHLAACAAFGPPYLFDTQPLRALIRRYVGRRGFEQILALRQRCDVAFTSVDLESGGVCTYGNQTPGIDPDALEAALLASASQPVLMNCVRIPGPGGNRLHADGGVREMVPVQQVLKSPFACEIDLLVVVDLSQRSPTAIRPPEDILGLLERTVALLAFEVGASDLFGAILVDGLLRARAALHRSGQWNAVEATLDPRLRAFLEARPRETLEFLLLQPESLPVRDSLHFDPGEMRAALAQGREEARTLLRSRRPTQGLDEEAGA